MGKRGNGEGSIFQNKKLNKWVGQYTVNGKRKAVYGNSRKEVKEKLINILSSIQTGRYISKNNVMLAQLLKDIEEMKLAANTIKESSYARNMATIRHIEQSELANLKVQEVSSNAVQQLLNSKITFGQSTIDKIYQTLNGGFQRAIEYDIILKNPMARVLKPVSTIAKQEVLALTIEEQNQLLYYLSQQPDSSIKNIILLSLFTGARSGEIGALTKDDIDFENKVISINKTLTKDKKYKVIMGTSTKTGRTKRDTTGKRQIPFEVCGDNFIENILKKQIATSKNILRNDKNLLFCKNNGNYIVPSEINNLFKVVCKNAGIQVANTTRKKSDGKVVNLKTSTVKFHMLRHTFATRCIESGMDAVVLSKLLGHSKIQTTLDTYVNVFDKFRNKKLENLNAYYKQNNLFQHIS